MVDRLLVDNRARDYPIVRRIADRFPLAPLIWRETDDGDPSIAAIGRGPLGNAKRTVFLKYHDGSFLKRFPDHPWYGRGTPCHHSLVLGYNCFCSCLYCFVQTVFDHPIPTLYVNLGNMIDELRSFLSNEPNAWVSTGEYLDSFHLDEITRLNEMLMQVFRDYPESTLELRTKIDCADHLPAEPPRGVLVSHSVSPPEVVKRLEPGTADFNRRMANASLLHEKGYRVAVRIDPIIPIDAYRSAYLKMPMLVEEQFGWGRVEKVFLGALRFDDALLKRMSRSPSARYLLDAEYVRCPDGRYRLHQNARVDWYRTVVNAIRRHRHDIEFRLTMEPDYVRRSVLG